MMTITVEPMHNGFKHLMVSGAIALLAIGGNVTSGQSNVTGQAWAGATRIAGKRMNCRAARVVKSKTSPGVGYALSGVIVLDPRKLRRYPSVVRRLIFLHECAHQYVGRDEAGADCWAVRIAKRQGWLPKRGVRQVCKSFLGSSGSQYHLPGPARCRAMIQCFDAAPTRKRKARRKARRKK